MFRPVNPSSRLPAVLQNGTKSNILWQFAGVVVFVAARELWECHKTRKFNKNYDLKLVS